MIKNVCKKALSTIWANTLKKKKQKNLEMLAAFL